MTWITHFALYLYGMTIQVLEPWNGVFLNVCSWATLTQAAVALTENRRSRNSQSVASKTCCELVDFNARS